MSDTAALPAAAPPKPAGAWQAFHAGLLSALRYWPLLAAFFAATLLVSGLLLLPLAQALFDWVGHRLAAWEMAPGVPGWLVAETLGGLMAQAQFGRPGIALSPWTLLTLPAWPFLLALPATLLSAGAIAVYSSGGGSAGRRFSHGLWRYGLTFLLLLFLETALYELSLLLTIALATLAALAAGSLWGILLVTPVLAAVVALIPWGFEYARTLAVVEGRRHAFRAMGRGFSFLRRNLGPAAVLALLHFLLTLAPYLPFLLWTRIWPAAWWGGTVVVQQLLVLALLGSRLARMAGQVALVQARRHMTALE